MENYMQRLTPEATEKYVQLLQQDVFRSTTRWPQFDLLVTDLVRLSESLPAGTRVISLERNLLYGGRSLFRPLFHHCDFTSVEMTPPDNSSRGSYNEHLLDNILSEFGNELFETQHHSPHDPKSLSSVRVLKSGEAEVLLVPNLLHHVQDLPQFFSDLGRILAPDGVGYIFDSTLREWHQIPDDYYRLTPWAIEHELQKIGCSIKNVETTGNPFEAILYCWEQALEYLPEADRERWANWLRDDHQPELRRLAEFSDINLLRRHTAFPTAYAVTFERSE